MSEETIFQQLEICQKQRDTALCQLAALREELASANADKEAYAQNAIDLRTSLDAVTLNLSRVDNTLFKTSQRLADAERRNESSLELLREVQKAARKQAWAHGYPTLFERIDAALCQLAALREELGQCKGEYDRSVNRVSELQDQLAYANKSADTYLSAWEKCAEFRDASEQRLADAERRNALMSGFLVRMFKGSGSDLLAAWQSEMEMVLADACLNKPEEAKS